MAQKSWVLGRNMGDSHKKEKVTRDENQLLCNLMFSFHVERFSERKFIGGGNLSNILNFYSSR